MYRTDIRLHFNVVRATILYTGIYKWWKRNEAYLPTKMQIIPWNFLLVKSYIVLVSICNNHTSHVLVKCIYLS